MLFRFLRYEEEEVEKNRIPILLNRFLIIAHSLHLLLIIVEYIINCNIINHLVYNVEYVNAMN